jgi:hypothetical protein
MELKNWYWCLLCACPSVVCEYCKHPTCSGAGCDHCKEMSDEVTRRINDKTAPTYDELPKKLDGMLVLLSEYEHPVGSKVFNKETGVYGFVEKHISQWAAWEEVKGCILVSWEDGESTFHWKEELSKVVNEI